MNPLQYINKIFCTLSAFCCGHILHSQVPQDATFPLEVAELIGLKMCDDYTLSYFVMNAPNDGYSSYNHGIIEHNQSKKSTQSTRIIDNFFNDFHNKKDGYQPSIDTFLRIDSIYPSQPKKKYQIDVKENKTKYSDVKSKPHLISIDEQTKNNTIQVKKTKGAIEKKWLDNDGNHMKNTIIFDEGRKILEITENTTKNTRKSLNYQYGTNDLLSKVEHYIWSDTDSTPFLKAFNYTYAPDNKLRYIEEDRKHIILHIGKDKIRVSAAYSANEYYMIEFFLDSERFISSYKYYKLTGDQNIIPAGNKQQGYNSVVTEAYQLQSHCIILCKY